MSLRCTEAGLEPLLDSLHIRLEWVGPGAFAAARSRSVAAPFRAALNVRTGTRRLTAL
jgi:hypothetical protein